MIEGVEVKRDANGMWLHPAIPWNRTEEDTDLTPFIRGLGYEPRFQTLAQDAPDDIVERYADSNEQDCSYWTPIKPEGDWFLAAIFDTEDGPAALWIKPIIEANEHVSSA
jgi:hypothetical protein